MAIQVTYAVLIFYSTSDVNVNRLIPAIDHTLFSVPFRVNRKEVIGLYLGQCQMSE